MESIFSLLAQVWEVIYVVGAVILLFGAAIFVHEFGHYWVARRLGMKVEAFAIGFGPKIMSWVRDGIEYSWRWIPAGGFVRLPQMMTSDALEGSAEGKEPVPPASPLSKILVAFAGPFMNVVFAFAIAVVIFFAGLPKVINPPVVGYVPPDSAEAEMGIQNGDTIVRVAGKKTDAWQDVYEIAALTPTNVLEVVFERDGNLFTNHLATVENAAVGLKVLNIEPRDHPVASSVLEGQPAAEAGIEDGDVFVKFAGVPIYSREQLIDLISKRPEEPTKTVVRRGEELIELEVTPRLDSATGRGLIGVMLGSGGDMTYEVQRPGPLPWEQLSEVWNKMVMTLNALIHSSETGVGAKDLSGPVGILAMLALWVKTDWRLALDFLVLLNVNLAILNLLPVPVLDGGHIIMSVIERIWRKPLNARIVEWTTTAFALLLISFMLYVTFFDVKRVPFFKELFDKTPTVENVKSPGPGQAEEVAPADSAP
ncbi:MAG: RIP metalloprotease RseP [Verrucomicrobia bacterium]|nr:RIP metalloprotease RseP [Verrucomicrobiota bacterium]MCF7709058.1 RIP metalloprotease RseP [Verrucomicrobiota bacterium]